MEDFQEFKDFPSPAELQKEFLAYKFQESVYYRHEKNTVFIDASSIHLLDKIIDVELVSEKAKVNGFVVLKFAQQVRPFCSDETMQKFLKETIVPDDQDHILRPYLLAVSSFHHQFNPSASAQSKKHHKGKQSHKRVPIGVCFSQNVLKPCDYSEPEIVGLMSNAENNLTKAILRRIKGGEKSQDNVIDIMVGQPQSQGIDSSGTDTLSASCSFPEPTRKRKKTNSSPFTESQMSGSLTDEDVAMNRSGKVGFVKEKEDRLQILKIPLKQEMEKLRIHKFNIASNNEEEIKLVGGKLSPVGLLDDNCICGVKDCRVKPGISIYQDAGLSLLHHMYHQTVRQKRNFVKYECSEMTRLDEEASSSQKPNVFECMLRVLMGLDENAIHNAIYLVARTFLEVEQPCVNEQKGQGMSKQFDMRIWMNDIRRCFDTDINNGLTSPWTYVGFPLTTFYTHLEDYGAFNSSNLLVYGCAKWWIFVAPKYRDKLERFLVFYLRKYARIGGKIRVTDPVLFFPMCMPSHKMSFIHPLLLEKAGIPFKLVIQNPGDMVITAEGAFHWGINSGFNMAYAQNMIFADFRLKCLESFLNPLVDVTFCKPTCPYMSSVDKESPALIFDFLINLYQILLSGIDTHIRIDDLVAFWRSINTVNQGEKNLAVEKKFKKAMKMRLDDLKNYLKETTVEVAPFLSIIQTMEAVQINFLCEYKLKVALCGSKNRLKLFPDVQMTRFQLDSYLESDVFSPIYYTVVMSEGSNINNNEEKEGRATGYDELRLAFNDIKDLSYIKKQSKEDHGFDLRKAFLELENCDKSKSSTLNHDESVCYFSLQNHEVAVLVIQEKKLYFICMKCLRDDSIKTTIKTKIGEILGKSANSDVIFDSQDSSSSKCFSVIIPKIQLTRTFGAAERCIIGVHQNYKIAREHAMKKREVFICSKCPRKCDKSTQEHDENNSGDDDEEEKEGKRKEKEDMKKMETFQTSTLAIIHARTIHETWKIYCPFCGLDFSSPQNLKDHIKDQEQSCVKFYFEDIDERKYKCHNYVCRSCGASCVNADQVTDHFERHESCVPKL